MRVGVDARSLLTAPPRGEGQTLLRLYGEIAALEPEWSYFFYTDRPVHADARRYLAATDKFRVRVLEVPGWRFDVWERLALPVQCRLDRLDVFHGFSSGLPPLNLVRTLLTVHDVIPLRGSWVRDEERIRFKRRLVAGVRQSRLIACPSASTRSDLMQQKIPLRTDPVVIPWGATASESGNRALRARSDDSIVAFGGSDARKNTMLLIEAFRHIALTCRRLTLTIIGVDDSRFAEDLRMAARDIVATNQVRILGFVEERTRDALLDDAALLVYPSLYEGFGLPVLDAMCKGLPVAASAVSSIPEVGGDAVAYFDPYSRESIADTVLAIMDSPARRDAMRLKGLCRSRMFTWAHAAERYRSALAQVGSSA